MSELGGAPRARGATSGEEVKESTYTGVLKAVDGLGRVFWSHSPSGVTPKLPMGGVLWPESGGHSTYQDSDQGRDFRRRLVEGSLTAEDTSTILECFSH